MQCGTVRLICEWRPRAFLQRFRKHRLGELLFETDVSGGLVFRILRLKKIQLRSVRRGICLRALGTP